MVYNTSRARMSAHHGDRRRASMIVANVRGQLQRDDAQLALRLIGRGSRAEYDRAEATLRDRGFDELLDDPRLLQGLVESRHGVCASYPLFSYVIVRHALCEQSASRIECSRTTWRRSSCTSVPGPSVLAGRRRRRVVRPLADLIGRRRRTRVRRSFSCGRTWATTRCG